MENLPIFYNKTVFIVTGMSIELKRNLYIFLILISIDGSLIVANCFLMLCKQ